MFEKLIIICCFVVLVANSVLVFHDFASYKKIDGIVYVKIPDNDGWFKLDMSKKYNFQQKAVDIDIK